MSKKNSTILQSIKTVLRQVLPQNGKAILFGSQARGDAGENSDWDILILLDKQKLDATDYDEISYPLRELGWKMKACINPVMYTLKDWMKYSFSPFYHNVTKDGVELV
ncbi:MAG TPA: nucleotidyltransferase domain-containing protein, partial [Candidatus Parabacteroides intestinavium]|nr:nucleotidyltransferase domain-containing protein [Candidatus Parabacteroides intestinavium]